MATPATHKRPTKSKQVCQVTELIVKNFKSYKESSLRLSPLTILIGPNASGKSNFLEAIRLQSWLASGNRLESVFQAVQSEHSLVRGSIKEIFLNPQKTFTLGAKLTGAPDKWTNFSVELGQDDSELRIVGEKITKRETAVPLYEAINKATGYSHDIQVAYNNFVRGGVKPRIECTDQQLVLTQLRTPARFGSGHKRAQDIIPDVCNAFVSALAEIVFLDPSPRRMRSYSHELDRDLKEDGSNLSSVLYGIVSAGGKEDLLRFIRSLPEQDIDAIDFVVTPRQEVMVRLVESFAGKLIHRDAPVLSDGTLRVLSIAASVLSAPEGSVVIIEEIDNGVHPSRASTLLENLLNVANRRRLKVLLTTHNPALLDAVPPDSIPDIACCFRDPITGNSRIVHLSDSDNYTAIVAQGHLGQLMSKGMIEIMLKDPRTRSEKDQTALDWLHARES